MRFGGFVRDGDAREVSRDGRRLALSRRTVTRLRRLVLPAAALAVVLPAQARVRLPEGREGETASPASAIPREVRQACTGCQALPPPDILPREAWEPTVSLMKGFALEGVGAPTAGPPPLVDFDLKRVVEY